jgi:signal transduction histidine kinase
VPAARDELRGLAQALNALLSRRDEATRRLQRFTGDAAHELRSPVASILAQAEVAALHPDPDEDHEVLVDVLVESRRLSTMINDLLVLARSDAGELPPAVAVDVVFALEAAIERLTADAAPVRVEAAGRTCSALAAPHEVELVLDNVLRNAARYARASIVVSVLPAGRELRVLVDDDGEGIAAGDRAKVLDRFYRAGGERSRGGSGLGLALVYELVTRRAGSVRVGQSPDGGTRIELRWPAAAVS